MRRGVWILIVLSLAVAVGAGSARADGVSTTTTTATTTAASAPLAKSYLPSDCVGAGAAAIAEPDRRELALGTPASGLGPSGYPADAHLVSVGSTAASGSTCRSASVTLSSVSLFGGAVTASSVTAQNGRGSVTGLAIDGTPVTVTPGEQLHVDDWGLVTLGAQAGRLQAPLVLNLLAPHASLPAGTTIFVAFSARSAPVTAVTHEQAQAKHGSAAHASRSTHRAGGGHAATGHAKKHHHHHRKPVPQPLKWTPRLGIPVKRFVFPVDGGASYVDTYGGNRSDIYDGWHHGDDLFASLGTPVVAVVRGKLSLVGWNSLGGWRLWLTDKEGNSFYYAHLAGYARWILKHRNVRPGQVIGFVGHTGDAFTTPPHLHFEVHPHQLLKLDYDGAVDPTTYLKKWRVVHVPKKELPAPARLKAPVGTPAEEAAVVWHELLVARHLLPAADPTILSGLLRRPFPTPSSAPSPQSVAAVRLSARLDPQGGPSPLLLVPVLAGLLAVGAAAFALRRRLARVFF